jgi:uncharacterized protein YkwD
VRERDGAWYPWSMRLSASLRPLVLIASVSLAGCADEAGEGGEADELGDGDGDEVGEGNEFCAEVDDWDPDWTMFEDQVLVLVNQNRAAGANCGGTQFAATGPLTMDPALRCAARYHSRDMAINDYFDHTSLTGTSFVDRSESAEYDASPIGENIAAGQPTPDAVVGDWMTSPGHCSNIMNPDANEIGVGYMAADMATYSGYWTQVFGHR